MDRQQIIKLVSDKKVVNHLNKLDERGVFKFLTTLTWRYKEEHGLEPVDSYIKNIKNSYTFKGINIVDAFYKGGKFVVVVGTPVNNVLGVFLASTCRGAMRSIYAEKYDRKNVRTIW